MYLILLVVLILLFAGSGPWWGYSREWGPAPVSFVGLLLVILLVLLLLGAVPAGPVWVARGP